MIANIPMQLFDSQSSIEKEAVSKKIVNELVAKSCCVVTFQELASLENEKIIDISKRLFERPSNEKLRYAAPSPLRPGFSPYGRSRALDTGIENTLETWDIDLNAPINFPTDMALDWGYIVKYQDKVFNLATTFFKYLCLGLCVDASLFLGILKRVNGGIHFIHYLPYEDTFHPKARRQSRHRDMTLITILPAPNEGGLEVEIDGRWIPVHLKPNEFLIQAGLLLERMLGGFIKACLHTVETPDEIKAKHRYAFPYFASPSGETRIGVIPNFISEKSKEKYPDDLVRNINADYFSRIFRTKI